MSTLVDFWSGNLDLEKGLFDTCLESQTPASFIQSDTLESESRLYTAQRDSMHVETNESAHTSHFIYSNTFKSDLGMNMKAFIESKIKVTLSFDILIYM